MAFGRFSNYAGADLGLARAQPMPKPMFYLRVS
jgi:hypothetical protein